MLIGTIARGAHNEPYIARRNDHAIIYMMAFCNFSEAPIV